MFRKKEKKVDYVAVYLAGWKSPRNELNKVGGFRPERERTRLERKRGALFARYETRTGGEATL